MITGTIALSRRTRRTIALHICMRTYLQASTALRFNLQFRLEAAVPLLRPRIAQKGGDGILTVLPSPSPSGLCLGPDSPRDD